MITQDNSGIKQIDLMNLDQRPFNKITIILKYIICKLRENSKCCNSRVCAIYKRLFGVC